MSNEFTLPVTYPSVTRSLPEVTKLPTVTYPQVSRGRAQTALYCNRRRKGKAARKVRSLPIRFRIRKKEEQYMTEARRKNTVRKRGDEHKSVRLEYGKTNFRDIYKTVT